MEVRVYHHGRMLHRWSNDSNITTLADKNQWCFIIANTTDSQADVENVRSVLSDYKLTDVIEQINIDDGLANWFGNKRLAGYVVATRKAIDCKCHLVLIVESDVMFPPNFHSYLRKLKPTIGVSFLGRGLVSSKDTLASITQTSLGTLLHNSSYSTLKDYHQPCDIRYLLSNKHRVDWHPPLLTLVKLTPEEQVILVSRLYLSPFHQSLLLSSKHPYMLTNLRDHLWKLKTPLNNDEIAALKVRLSGNEPVYCHEFVGDHWCDDSMTRLNSRIKKHTVIITDRFPRPEHVLYWSTLPGTWIKLTSRRRQGEE